MTRTTKRILWSGVAGLLLVLAVPIINLVTWRGDSTVLSANAKGDDALLAAAQAIEQNCLDCHSQQEERPFYAALPVVGGLVEEDIQAGRRFIDLVAELAPATGIVAEPALAKIEHVVEQGLMPPTRYVALHWDRSLGGDEEQAVLTFVRRHRGAHYATGKASEANATAALQPLPDPPKEDPAKVALGRALYHDTRLSGDGTLSCASCHGLLTGGCDQVDVSTGIRGQKGPINSPTVLNSAFYLAQFWDGRAKDLKEQAAGPVENPIEMGARWDDVVATLQQDPALVAQVAAVYGAKVSKDNVTDAIAAFERTLVTPNAPFDKWLAGDASAMSEQATRGYHLFVDNACATCHVGKAIGGQSYELMGLRAPYFEGREVKDVDRGRYNVTKDDRDMHRFKVPTLRNVALTFPYFHDASAKTLEEAVVVMARHQAPRPFADAEAKDVVAFLEALTGELDGQPLTAR